MHWTIREIDKAIKKDTFDCGAPPLNDYLKKYARQNHDIGLGKTYVAVDHSQRAVGYYTISSAQVASNFLPEKMKKSLPKYPIPAIRIARLAVDSTLKGKGLGGELLAHALTTILEISARVGVFLVLVDAKDDNAVNFYLKFGFVQFLDNRNTLFLPLSTVSN